MITDQIGVDCLDPDALFLTSDHEFPYMCGAELQALGPNDLKLYLPVFCVSGGNTMREARKELK